MSRSNTRIARLSAAHITSKSTKSYLQFNPSISRRPSKTEPSRSVRRPLFDKADGNDAQEGKNGVIELKAADGDTEEFDEACDDPEIVKLMVEYFYHLDYPRPKDSTTSTKSTRQSTKKLRYSHPTWDSSGQEIPPQAFDAEQPNVSLMQHAKLFTMAVKYQIDGLRHLITQKFKEAVATQWSHEDFAHTIHIVYNSTAEDVTELREIVADAVHAHFEELQERPGVEVSMRSIAALTYGLLTRSRERNRNKGYYY